MSLPQKMDNTELAAKVAELAGSLKQMGQIMGERARIAKTSRQTIALQTSARYLASAVSLVDQASKALAATNWDAS